MFVSSDVTNLMYSVSVDGTESSSQTITTIETQHCLYDLTPCQEYIITVIPFSTSSDYVGASNSIMDTIDGGNLKNKEGTLSEFLLFTNY